MAINHFFLTRTAGERIEKPHPADNDSNIQLIALCTKPVASVLLPI